MNLNVNRVSIFMDIFIHMAHSPAQNLHWFRASAEGS